MTRTGWLVPRREALLGAVAMAAPLAARSLFESIDAAGSTDPMAIVEALELWKAPA
jgi:hypothetical protein